MMASEKEEEGSIVVFRYGLLAPTKNAMLVQSQISAAHRYRNTLIEIERGRREAHREALSSDPVVAELEVQAAAAETAVAVADLAIRNARKKSRSRSETTSMRDALSDARRVRKDIAAVLKEHRYKARATLNAELERINTMANELVKSARAHCGVYWGTYLLVEDAMQAMKKAPIFIGTMPNNPYFIRYMGEGSIGVQIQHGMLAEELFGEDPRARIDPVNEAAWTSPKRSERRLLSRTVLHVRVGSEDRKRPIFASFPMVMHRAFPPKAIVKRITVHKKMIGPREEWYATVTLSLPPEVKLRNLPAPEHAIAIDVGWRQFDNEIRISTWVDTFGNKGDFRLSAHTISGLRKSNELRSVRDDNLNRMKKSLLVWFGEHPDLLPEWLRAKVVHLFAWRSCARLQQLFTDWDRCRFSGDEEIFQELAAWKKQDTHLWQWETSQRVGSIRNLREQYRIFVSKLAKKYGTVVLEEFDLRTFAVRKEDEAENETARSNRHLVAVSRLRLVILSAYGKRVHSTSAVNSTLRCNICGSIQDFDKALDIKHVCTKCGATWDQDENAARNLLDAWKSFTPESKAPSTKEKRWAKVARMAGKKKEEVDADSSR